MAEHLRQVAAADERARDAVDRQDLLDLVQCPQRLHQRQQQAYATGLFGRPRLLLSCTANPVEFDGWVQGWRGLLLALIMVPSCVNLVIRTYADHFQSKTPPVVTYNPPQELRAGRFEIPTRVVTDAQTYSISYRLDYDTPSRRWRVYDIVAEGVSLISNYRAQFDPIVHKSGAAGLIQTLEAKLADASAR
jgi:hypothetical protein